MVIEVAHLKFKFKNPTGMLAASRSLLGKVEMKAGRGRPHLADSYYELQKSVDQLYLSILNPEAAREYGRLIVSQ